MRSLIFCIGLVIGVIGITPAVLVAQESRANPATLGGQISGQVRYAEGGQPAFNVVVNCDSLNSGSCGQEMTDRSGRFRFGGLAPSQYVITVRVAGFIEQKQDVELLTSPSATLQFQLRSDGSAQPAPASSFVVDAAVPASAKKEFDQASAALAKGKKEGIEEAARHLEKALSLYPQFLEANLMLGTAYMDLNQWDKAEQTLKKALEINPRAVNASFALGEVYLHQKKYDQAESTLQQGLSVESRSARAHLILARVYWDKVAGVKEEAQWRPVLEKSYQEVKQALELDSNLAGAHLLRGNLTLKAGRLADAQHEFEEYLRLDPKGPAADQTRALVDRIKKARADQKPPSER